jgi:hypothetical protein
MNSLQRRFLYALLTGSLAFGLCPARADDVEMLKEKLFQAKKDYDSHLQKFKKAVADLLDKREADARKAGNKKLLDQIKAEREAFKKTGEPPLTIPNAILNPLTAAMTKVDKAYSAAIKEYVRLKMDDAANTAEKGQEEFKLSSLVTIRKRAYLVTLKEFDLKADIFTNNGIHGSDVELKLNGEPASHSILLHPYPKGSSEVSYPLDAKWTVFRATIGIPNPDGTNEGPRSPITFEVVADGKSLWKSKPVVNLEEFQTCILNVEKVKTLTLRTHCPGSNFWAWAYWFDPILVE